MEYLWYYFPAAALINGLTSVVLGIFLLYKNYSAKVNQRLAIFCASIAGWALAYFLWQMADNYDSALFWCRAFMFPAILAPTAYLHFIIVFLNKEQRCQSFLKFLYILVIFWEILNFTPQLVSGVESRSLFTFWPTPGFFFTPFMIYFFFGFLYAFYLLWKELKTALGVYKIQISIILLGTFIALIGASTNFYLWYNIPIAPWGNVLVSLYVWVTAYAIIKYRFLDLTLTLKRSLVYGLTILAVFIFWALFSPYFNPPVANIFQINFIFSAFVVTFVTALSLPFLAKLLQIKKIFYLLGLALVAVAIILIYLSQITPINWQDFDIITSLILFYIFTALTLLLLASYIFFTGKRISRPLENISTKNQAPGTK